MYTLVLCHHTKSNNMDCKFHLDKTGTVLTRVTFYKMRANVWSCVLCRPDLCCSQLLPVGVVMSCCVLLLRRCKWCYSREQCHLYSHNQNTQRAITTPRDNRVALLVKYNWGNVHVGHVVIVTLCPWTLTTNRAYVCSLFNKDYQ
jgi:hypothetical protein